jgi:SAM-dependent methyltransferase
LSISFDRAADYYDATRALPAEDMARLVGVLQERLRPAGRALEIGAGTGRYTVPLRAAGVDIQGLDLSRPMLRRLRQKSSTLPVVQGDAAALPYRSGAFGSVLAVHVLHLIPYWRAALAEAVRVLRPRGVLLVEAGHSEHGNPVERTFFESIGVEFRHPGLRATGELRQEAELLGGRTEPAIEVPVVQELRLADYVDQLEAGLFSRCWDLDQAARRRAAAATRQWAEDALGDIHQTLRYERTVVIHTFRFA